MPKTSAGTPHRHLDSRAKWTTNKAGEPEHTHEYANQFTAAEVTALKALLAATGGGTGTTPVPNPTPDPPPDVQPANIAVSSVTTTGAVISWTTGDATTGFVEYGLIGQTWTATASTSSGVTGSRTLSGLTPGIQYGFRVRTTDGTVTGVSSDRSFTTQQVIPVPSPLPVAQYGSAVSGDTLANTTVGPNGNRVSLRFVASETGPLPSFRWFRQGGAGYAAGDGGTYTITLQSDSAGKPSGTVLATATLAAPGTGSSVGQVSTFGTAPNVIAGTRYHVVFVNTSASPGSNYTSVNALLSWVSGRSPKYPTADWMVELSTGGAWSDRGYLPIIELAYASGNKSGIGYMECWVSTPGNISGANKVRERFTPTAEVSVATVAVRLQRDHGLSPLTIELAGETTTIPASAFPLGTAVDNGNNKHAWGSAALVVVLPAGVEQNLVLSTASDTLYRAQAIRQGSAYGYSAGSYFGDGRMEVSSGGAWSGINGSTEGDLQWWCG